MPFPLSAANGRPAIAASQLATDGVDAGLLIADDAMHTSTCVWFQDED